VNLGSDNFNAALQSQRIGSPRFRMLSQDLEGGFQFVA
jgi:hypothetical protein